MLGMSYEYLYRSPVGLLSDGLDQVWRGLAGTHGVIHIRLEQVHQVIEIAEQHTNKQTQTKVQ